MNDPFDYEAYRQQREVKELEILKDFIEIRLKAPDDDFHIIRETLTRVGVGVPAKKVLCQSCHILRKKGKYYLVHFKELFKLDNKPSSFNNEDLARRNTIANMLAEWNLFTIIDPSKTSSPILSSKSVTVISSSEKSNWILEAKYNIGAIKKNVLPQTKP